MSKGDKEGFTRQLGVREIADRGEKYPSLASALEKVRKGSAELPYYLHNRSELPTTGRKRGNPVRRTIIEHYKGPDGELVEVISEETDANNGKLLSMRTQLCVIRPSGPVEYSAVPTLFGGQLYWEEDEKYPRVIACRKSDPLVAPGIIVRVPEPRSHNMREYIINGDDATSLKFHSEMADYKAKKKVRALYQLILAKWQEIRFGGRTFVPMAVTIDEIPFKVSSYGFLDYLKTAIELLCEEEGIDLQ